MLNKTILYISLLFTSVSFSQTLKSKECIELSKKFSIAGKPSKTLLPLSSFHIDRYANPYMIRANQTAVSKFLRKNVSELEAYNYVKYLSFNHRYYTEINDPSDRTLLGLIQIVFITNYPKPRKVHVFIAHHSDRTKPGYWQNFLCMMTRKVN